MTIMYKGQAIKIITRNEMHFRHELPAFTLINNVCYASAEACRECKFSAAIGCVDNVIKSHNFREQFPELFI